MEVLMLIGLTGLAGYYFKSGNGSNSGKVGTETISNIEDTKKQFVMLENEKPNSLNIYSGNKVESINDQLLNMSLYNYKQAENPSLTNVLPPIYNSYSVSGSDTILNVNVNEPNLSQINDVNRRQNVVDIVSPELNNRPMFTLQLDTFNSNEDQVGLFNETTNTNQEISLLTGKTIEREHSNMIPFFGSNIKQNIETFTNEAKLDQLSGNTSTFIHKKEPLQRFDKIQQNIYGSPLLTDKIDTSRFIPSVYKQNEKPFIEDKVSAPIARTINNPLSNIKEPTIDKLRVANKQQVSYDGRTLSGPNSSVRGISADIMKNRPDTHYELGPDRLFTSTGAIIANKAMNNYENLQTTARQEQTTGIPYFGGIKHAELLESGPRLAIKNTTSDAFYSEFQEPKNVQLASDTSRNIASIIPTTNGYGKNSINLPELERNSTNVSHTLNINKSDSGHKKYLQDDLRDTIKQTLLGKHDNSGNFKAVNKDRSLTTDLTDYTFKTTNKESLIDNKYSGQLNKNDGMGYIVKNPFAKVTNKEITSDFEYSGPANDINKNSMVYSTYDNPEKVRNAIHIENYNGSGASSVSATENRMQFNNANISNKKETLLKGERPSGRKSTLGTITNNDIGNVKLTNNMLLKEREKTRVENVNTQQLIPSKNSVGKLQDIYNKYSEVENNRFNQNDISTQLSNNPFYNLD